MKKFILLMFVSCLFISSIDAQSKEEIYGEIAFDTLDFDLGNVSDKPVIIHLSYSNKGPGDLKIYHIVTPCVCTKAQYSKEALKPKQKGNIEIKFNPETLPKGPFTRSITILHDGSDRGNDQVTLKGIKN